MNNSFSVMQRLLRHHDLLADPSVLNLFYAMGIDGPIDVSALRSAFASLLEFYPVLGLAPDNEHEAFALIDLSERSLDETESVLTGLIEQERRRSHDTHAGLLMRATLVRLLPAKYLLLLSFHHAAADGWSLALYAGHLGRAYNALRQGEPIPKSVQPRPAGSIRHEERMERERTALRMELGGLKANTIDPFEKRQIDEATPLYWSSTIDFDFVNRLQTISANHRATLFSLLATAVAKQLQQMIGLSDLVLGTTVLGRRSSAEMAAGGAYYRGALLALRGPDFDLQIVNKAVAAAVDRHLSYEEQLSILSAAIKGASLAGPAVFVLADSHPMSALQFQGVEVSVVVPSGRMSQIPKPAHSPNCGRVALFWRQGMDGASLTVFTEPSLAGVARELQEGTLRYLATWVGAAPKEQGSITWHGSLVKSPAPIVEAVSPVRLPPGHDIFGRNANVT